MMGNSQRLNETNKQISEYINQKDRSLMLFSERGFLRPELTWEEQQLNLSRGMGKKRGFQSELQVQQG